MKALGQKKENTEEHRCPLWTSQKYGLPSLGGLARLGPSGKIKAEPGVKWQVQHRGLAGMRLRNLIQVTSQPSTLSGSTGTPADRFSL